ncbi:uncharacterized protein MONOS_14702 [Monocercomonoides exilis]|uniref:uncharacterized protein n=1 Tax=Monocercomonoides exilis TaxID=2049356 RepID=UPI00355ABC5B|nr:hypothetical protein MONOS_14702 [Monocercomonoides exilis]|eukprot:MONOS_14702.1-p1 / transcript=MONOS_14702.1 / gene=MONOS_14702 / organism=Monocercomonoides_exilis_PA203 / gene_product=unspecified product / transcript_product=unspecified product / location=Mono_scaffold01054:15009-15257(-) / protein_length=83 / sequence_SO=supercontig / SO=protein_coding / is_pseudo=false
MALSKVHVQTICEQKALFKEVIEKQKTGLVQSEKKQKKMKVSYEEKMERLVVQVKELKEKMERGNFCGRRKVRRRKMFFGGV